MTPIQAAEVIDVLKATYPHYYKNMTDDEIFNISNLWSNQFESEEVEHVVSALHAFISTDTKGFPPPPGALKQWILNIKYGQQKSALEAWAEVKKALKNSGYGYIEEFEKLDTETRRIVGSPSQLKEWSQTDSETLDTVVASNFRDSYKAVSKSQREYASLPGPVADLVNQLAAAKDLNPEPEKPKAPKALPVSVRATVEELSRASGVSLTSDIPKPLSKEEFERKKAEMLRELGVCQ